MSTQPVRLSVSLSPHAKSSFTTNKAMWAVVAALVPAIIAAVVVFGPRALLVLGVSVLTCILTEFAVESLFFSTGLQLSRKQPRGGNPFVTRPSILDGSAIITGLLLAMNIPVGIPLWQVVVGGIFAIGIAKMVFGGLGQNPFNPALAGRAFMLASFPVSMTTWDKPLVWQQGADAVTGPTALGALKEGLRQGNISLDQINSHLPSWFDLFIGSRGGCIGEVSILALLIGGLFLLVTRIINWEIPLFFLGSLAALTGVMWLIDPGHYANPIFHLLTGGAILGAFFMATDMVTSPMTFLGRIIFATGAGLLTATIRLFGSYPEGVSYAILIMNAIVPLIDRNLPPRRFGSQGIKQSKEAVA